MLVEPRSPAESVFPQDEENRRLDEYHPTTDQMTIYGLTELPEQPEVRHGVKFIMNVSQLRWKLWRKAKQEPKFRFYALYDRIYRFDFAPAKVTRLESPQGMQAKVQNIFDEPEPTPTTRPNQEPCPPRN